jgi:hypothetical protein
VFGAELRSINSANIYGTQGAVADGANTLAYLIGHNFAYIGTNADTSNNPSTVVQGNETQRLNSGKIYYESDDQSGNVRVGTVFSVNQATGVVTFNANTFNLGSAGSISLAGASGNTYIDKFAVIQSNIKFAGNTISSLSGAVNLLAYSAKTYLNTNVAVTGNLGVTGNTNIKGSVTLGNQTSDTIQVTDRLTQTVYPNTTNAYDLGGAYFTTTIATDWLKVAVGNTSTTIPNFSTILNQVLVSGYALGDINQDGSITSADSSFVLNYLNNGTSGTATNDSRIRLAFATLATYASVIASAVLWSPYRWNTAYYSNLVNVNGVTQISNNTITTLTTNTNLIISANGTGIISIPSNNVTIQNNLIVNSGSTFTNVTIGKAGVSGSINVQAAFGNIVTYDFYFYLQSWADQFKAVSPAVFTYSDNSIAQTFTGATFSSVTPNGPYWQVTVSNYSVTSATWLAGNANKITYNTVVASPSNTNLTNTWNLTGNFDQTGNTYITGTLVNQSNILQTNIASYFQASNVKILSNTISTTNTNGNLNLTPNGSGKVQFNNRLAVLSNEISNTWSGATGTQLNINFAPNGTGNTIVNSTTYLRLPIGNNTNRTLSNLGEVRFNDVSGFIESYAPSGYVNWMQLYSSNRLTYITPELTPNLSDDILRFAVNNTVTTTLDTTKLSNSTLLAGNVRFNTNTIYNNDTSLDITLQPNGTGWVNFKGLNYVRGQNFRNPTSSQFQFQQTGQGYVKFAGNSGVTLPAGDKASRPPIPQGGQVRYNTETTITEIFDPINTIWIPVSGTASSVTSTFVEDLTLVYTLVLGGL